MYTDCLIKNGAAKLTAEIGGPGKGRQQFKGINIDPKAAIVENVQHADGTC